VFAWFFVPAAAVYAATEMNSSFVVLAYNQRVRTFLEIARTNHTIHLAPLFYEFLLLKFGIGAWF